MPHQLRYVTLMVEDGLGHIADMSDLAYLQSQAAEGRLLNTGNR